MDPRRRRELAHYAAPIAFLAAATIAVLLIKAGLGGGSGNTSTAAETSTPTTTTVARTTRRATTTTAARYYTIQSGDTLGSVAIKENTTVDTLLRLNPGVDPEALHVGQRIRVG